MSSYSLLGATGQVGGEVLRVLLEMSSIMKPKINVLVRSKAKLEKQLQTESFQQFDTSNVEVFEAGGVTDIKSLAKCIKGTRALFMCAAGSTNKPGSTIAQDQAKAVISALRVLQEEDEAAKLPRLVVLSSAEAEETPYFSADIPWPMRNILFAANSHLYVDLIAAEKFLQSQGDWFDFCIIKSGGISKDIARGHQVSFDKQQTFISYTDLAGGMIDVANDESSKYNGRNVSVLSPGGKARVEWASVPLLFKGLLIHLFPFLYTWFYA